MFAQSDAHLSGHPGENNNHLWGCSCRDTPHSTPSNTFSASVKEQLPGVLMSRSSVKKETGGKSFKISTPPKSSGCDWPKRRAVSPNLAEQRQRVFK